MRRGVLRRQQRIARRQIAPSRQAYQAIMLSAAGKSASVGICQPEHFAQQSPGSEPPVQKIMALIASYSSSALDQSTKAYHREAGRGAISSASRRSRAICGRCDRLIRHDLAGMCAAINCGILWHWAGEKLKLARAYNIKNARSGTLPKAIINVSYMSKRHVNAKCLHRGAPDVAARRPA